MEFSTARDNSFGATRKPSKDRRSWILRGVVSEQRSRALTKKRPPRRRAAFRRERYSCRLRGQEIPPALLIAVKTVLAPLTELLLIEPLFELLSMAASNVTMVYDVLLDRPKVPPFEPTL